MNKLIGMTDFVLNIIDYVNESHNHKRGYDLLLNYTDFLEQPLELWMFVPCKLVDGVWVVLEEPKCYNHFRSYPQAFRSLSNKQQIECCNYTQAKEKCLFEGIKFAIYNKGRNEIDVCFIEYKINNPSYIMTMINSKMTIEDLVKYEPLLTKTAIKQLSL